MELGEKHGLPIHVQLIEQNKPRADARKISSMPSLRRNLVSSHIPRVMLESSVIGKGIGYDSERSIAVVSASKFNRSSGSCSSVSRPAAMTASIAPIRSPIVG